MRDLTRLRSARVISAGHAFVQNLRRGHYELGLNIDPRHRLTANLRETRPRRLIEAAQRKISSASRLSNRPEQWNELQHELQRRIGAIVEQGRLTDDHTKRLHHDVLALVDERVIEVIARRGLS